MSDSKYKKFSSLKISPKILQVIDSLKFDAMTSVQAESIPAVMSGRNLLAKAKTGSGKTAAFCIPILERVSLSDRRVQALILCPTRELCAQVTREMRRFGRDHRGLHVLTLSGGQPIAPQVASLEKGAHIVVGTPGRVLDLLSRHKLHLGRLRFFVLDEADRMLDMGFEDEMRQIFEVLPEKRQTLLFSATYPESIQEMVDHFVKDPVIVTVQEDVETKLIDEVFLAVDSDQRLPMLCDVLTRVAPKSAIVFCHLKATTDSVAQELSRRGIPSLCLNGDLEQFERDRVMAKFRNGSIKVLVATDVAARGIDIQQLDLVLNFDTPIKADVYVHRIGRTGRAGAKGLAVSLLSNKEMHKLEILSEYTKSKKSLGLLDQLPAAEVQDDLTFEDAVFETLCVFGGRKDKLRPGDILGALTAQDSGVSGADVGRIEIHDRLVYVAIRKSLVKRALDVLRDGKIKGRTFRVSIAP